MEIVCYGCQRKITADGKIGFKQDCSDCGHDLHSCVQCQHYDAKVYNECKETMADRILEKQKANYCEFFAPTQSGLNLPGAETKKNDLLAQAEALFKKK